jgi:hypothetical protein
VVDDYVRIHPMGHAWREEARRSCNEDPHKQQVSYDADVAVMPSGAHEAGVAAYLEPPNNQSRNARQTLV